MSKERRTPGRGRLDRSHEWIDARSLALAEAVGERIRADPSLLDVARKNLLRWRRRMHPWPHVLQEWEAILAEGSADEILAALVSDSEEGRRLRQSSPFAGILTPAERKEIFDRYEEIGT